MLITIGPVTVAARMAKLLEKEMNLKASVLHTPSELNKGGCSYSLRVISDDCEGIRNVARKYNMKIKHCYSETLTQRGRVYNVLS